MGYLAQYLLPIDMHDSRVGSKLGLGFGTGWTKPTQKSNFSHYVEGVSKSEVKRK